MAISANASAAEVTIEEGDTLWELAAQKKVSVEDLKKWNGLSDNIIHPEDKIKLQEYYEIIKGDSLWDIAQENMVSVKDLKEWNDIDSHIIHPGDKLIIDNKENKEEKEEKSAKVVTKEKVATKVEKAPAKQEEESNKKEITVEATAYTANCKGCSGTTKTGIDLIANPDKKVIAVDPDVIPLGSKVHVEGYGEAIAGDIGGGIDGNEIDVFIPSESKAKKWGRQEVQVKILN